jgi:hypothetical protein
VGVKSKISPKDFLDRPRSVLGDERVHICAGDF